MEAVGAVLAVGMMLLAFAFFALFYIGMFAFMILVLVFWILMLVDVIKHKFPNESDRTTWILVVALTGWIGAAIYYFTIKRPEDLKRKSAAQKQ